MSDPRTPVPMTNTWFKRNGEWIGAFAVATLVLWLISHARPDLWFLNTWSTGGDVASQVFYAKVFAEDWFLQGKTSGWLPESFMGFPAFTFYFPLPFILIGLLHTVVETPIAFKLVSMLPSFLIPASTFVMGRLFGWSLAVRLLAALGAAGFIITEATSIWGGNILAQLSGEFAYSWGMVFAILFWGALGWSLRHAGKRWYVAALLEAFVAMSHGYGLLMAGFGAFAFLLNTNQPRAALFLILRVHTLAFLLIGFWLIPLFENLPWTIPNDTSVNVATWETLWPPSLWPFSIGLLALIALPFLRDKSIALVSFTLAIGALGLFGFHTGHTVGLAEARFFPYAQWAAAVSLAVALGHVLGRMTPAPTLWAIAAMAVLMAFWEPHITLPEHWSRWNLEGYERKPMWPVYQQLAALNAGPLSGPRVLFEHDPANNDLGSTRTLEALPMFGSRPALEGLYMESAVSSPFIYQLQHELSARPSSPLSRYPTSQRSIDQAVGHLNELYTNRIILRSEEMKKRYSADSRFNLVADVGPFKILELGQLTTHLVDVISEPLHMRDRRDWLADAFRRFTLAHPYSERQVFLRARESIEAGNTLSTNQITTPRIIEMDREKLSFETNVPGVPHLVRMSYHPRWRSLAGETIYLVEPSFMMLVPKSGRVDLVFSSSWGNDVGRLFSFVGLGWLTVAILRRSPRLVAEKFGNQGPHAIPLLSVLALFAITTSAFWWFDPERTYYRAHELGARSDWGAAAKLFDSVNNRRIGPAQNAETLFWAARSFHLAHEPEMALERFLALVERYPESYWFAESAFRAIELFLDAHQPERAAAIMQQLERIAPDATWTTQARNRISDYAVATAAPAAQAKDN